MRTPLFGLSDPSSLPASTKTPSIYPGATKVTTRKEQTAGYATATIVTFQTTDKSESVFDFYRKALAVDGWEVGQAFHSRRSYRYIQVGGGAGLGSDPEFSFEVRTEETTDAMTNVTVNLVSYPSR
jgi:hypothetical protein